MGTDALVDIVIPLASNSESRWQDNELRFCLRSWQKHFRDLGRVFVCTVKPPSWLTNAVVIPVPDSHKHNKDANLIAKMLAACHSGVSDRFVRCSDDELLLRDCGVDDLKPFHSGALGSKPKKFWEGGWKLRMRHTFDVLVKNGETSFNFDTHLPKVYERDRFISVCERYDYSGGRGFCIDTWYLNHVPMEQRFQLNGEKLTLESGNPGDAEGILKAMAGRTYLGYNDKGLTLGLKQVLADLFPEPSRYECSST